VKTVYTCYRYIPYSGANISDDAIWGEKYKKGEEKRGRKRDRKKREKIKGTKDGPKYKPWVEEVRFLFMILLGLQHRNSQIIS
jgi:hypothetical protein